MKGDIVTWDEAYLSASLSGYTSRPLYFETLLPKEENGKN